MKVFLSFGKKTNGELVNISKIKSGRCDLICPFCDVSLIAVKGQQVQHHFRHDGEPCQESLNAIPQIPGWDHFHLSVPQECVDLLENRPKTKHKLTYKGGYVALLQRFQLIQTNDWAGVYELTEDGQIITGLLPLDKFYNWMRETLKRRFTEVKDKVGAEICHPGHLNIEAHRQQTLLNSTLYLLELTNEEGTHFYKVGRTRRDLAARVAEVRNQVSKVLNSKVTVKAIRSVKNAGFVEQFALYKYRAHKMPLASFQEYLVLDAGMAAQLKAEFTRLLNSNFPFEKAERFIATGRWQYEEKRLAKSKIGIAQTLASGSAFGRPTGTSLSNDKFLRKYQAVVDSLNSGFSINKTVEKTGVSRSTVKRVKNNLILNPQKTIR